MSPVHIIVGDDPRAEQIWATAFAGAVDLYRFDRNVDAFERLTSAQAPIDLVILTPAQRGPFNLTPDQLVARILEGSMATAPMLAKLHIIVVGQELARTHPRAISVSTLDAAIRLVKFGEVERAPQRRAAPVSAAPIIGSTPTSNSTSGSDYSSGVISRIWAAADASAHAADAPEASGGVSGGGPALPSHVPPAPDRSTQLFVKSAPAGFVVAPLATAQAAPSMQMAMPQGSITGGGPNAAPAQAPAQVLADAQLQAARQYSMPEGAGYRGPALRNGQVPAASHAAMSGGVPVPPALASQVQSMVYGSPATVADPVLVWSRGGNGQVVTAGIPVPQPVAQPAVVAAPIAAMPTGVPSAIRSVPLEPPNGVYSPTATPAPGAQPAHAPIAVPNLSPQYAGASAPVIADPFLQRAESQGGSVQFG